ncbi:MAG TPA: hypothetical protein VMV94_11695, partial [Phycisphaerae bacterium]|nr:hypothetical protein [Phycisphaerae bacterium]
TWGTVNDFKHFLPRIFELMVFKDIYGGGTDSVFVISKLIEGKWRSWPKIDQDAVMGFLFAWWRLALASHPYCDVPEPQEVLGALIRLQFGLSDWLTVWDQAVGHSVHATLQLASFASSVWGCIGRNEPVSRDATPEQTHLLLEWLPQSAHRPAISHLRQQPPTTPPSGVYDEATCLLLGDRAMSGLAAIDRPESQAGNSGVTK